MELTESGGSTGIALEFPITSLSPSSSSSPEDLIGKIPRRIRRRLLECNKTPSITSIQDIETKLSEANLRRQQFHAWLSNKARRKPKSPSWSSSQDEDLGQRLEAKLHAAEQKSTCSVSFQR
ncbi:T-complex protein [Thalictrum thalictroides]|uniref:T-complex protein n=1 Tax=Thalictrum thalictroides TaxID=46969 RepID=A0A7J6VR07_THATH|nr:T-complex protein [Thalictrum thalictroides]